MDKSDASDLAYEWHLQHWALGKRETYITADVRAIAAALLHLSNEVNLLRLTLDGLLAPTDPDG